MYCRNCGKQIADGAKFCPYCGTQQTAPAQAQPTQPPRAAQPAPAPQPAPAAQPTPETQPAPEPAPKPKKRKRWPIVLVVVLVLLVALAAVGYFVVWPWWQQKAATAGDETTAAASESTAESAAEATPSPTPEPTEDPATALANETKANLQKIYADIAEKNYEDAVSVCETVSSKSLEAYPKAAKFTEQYNSRFEMCAYRSFIDQNGNLANDELVPFCAAVYSNGTLMEVDLLTYTANTETLEHFYTNGTEDASGPITATMDDTGKMVSGEISIMQIQYTYDANGNILTEKWYDSGNSPLESTEYTYDANGNRTDSRHIVYNGGGGIGMSTHEVWSYDANGNQTEMRHYNGDDTTPLQQYYYSYEYDENGKVTKRVVTDGTGTIIETSVYDSDENVISDYYSEVEQYDRTWNMGRMTEQNEVPYARDTYYYYAPKSLLIGLNG